ncbi:hypothetical protein SBRCBS47491_005063 [Sporothrix bragantina]|uniref:Clr5 domain-containing protein n=1 Tax=Sporothrix bragantina TaxID=671064 RepID=A0ABP0BTT2_9PEZI
MIHSHYQPEQILWFLRNYWRFRANDLAQEWQRTFSDPNFGKSQYQWLKTRYGMKSEWGAALNHPPFTGANPGDVEDYVTPSIPAHPPRTTFRTRSDSPAPALITAPASVAAQGPVSHAPVAQAHLNSHPVAVPAGIPGSGPGSSQIRRPSAGMEQPSATSSTTGSTQTMASVMPTAGPGTYVFSNTNNPGGNGDQATPRSFSGLTSPAQGTYSFTSNMGHMSLGSPFRAPAVVNMAVPNSMNPIASAFAAGNGSMPNINGSFPMGASGNVDTSSPQMSVHQPMQAMSYGGQSDHPFQQQFPADFVSVDAEAQRLMNVFEAEYKRLGLKINTGCPGNAVFPAASPAAPAAAPVIPGAPVSPAKTPMSVTGRPLLNTAGRSGHQFGSSSRPNARVPSQAEIMAANIFYGTPLATSMVPPQSNLSQADTNNKRKRGEVEVDFQPPKRANMASSTHQASLPFQVVAAEPPSVVTTPRAGGRSTSAGARRESTPYTARSPPLASSAPSMQLNGMPSTAQVQESATSSEETEYSEHDGPHDGCTVNAPHHHDKVGRIIFQARADFKKAATSHNSVVNSPAGPVASAAPTTGPATPEAPTSVDDEIASILDPEVPTPEDAKIAAIFDMPNAASAVDGGQDVSMKMHVEAPIQAPVLAQTAVLVQDQSSTEAHLGAANQTFAEMAGLVELDFEALTEIGAAVNQLNEDMDGAPAPDSVAPCPQAPPATVEDTNSTDNTGFRSPLEEAVDDLSTHSFSVDPFRLNDEALQLFFNNATV